MAIIPNALDAFGVGVDGTGWFVLRSVLAAAWFIALAVLIVALVRERRIPEAGAA